MDHRRIGRPAPKKPSFPHISPRSPHNTPALAVPSADAHMAMAAGQRRLYMYSESKHGAASRRRWMRSTCPGAQAGIPTVVVRWDADTMRLALRPESHSRPWLAMPYQASPLLTQQLPGQATRHTTLRADKRGQGTSRENSALQPLSQRCHSPSWLGWLTKLPSLYPRHTVSTPRLPT